jgi:lipopolysaccharide biosynthesis glycosyltransferase
MEHLPINLKYFILDLTTLFDAGCARLNIFKYEGIESYDKIIYLDTDILINSDVNILLSLKLSNDKIYTLEEGVISQHFYGSWFFDFTKIDRNTTAFTSGIMIFHNNNIIKTLFDDIQKHIHKYIVEDKQEIPDCLDQPFIVFNAITQNKYDNTLLKDFVENNPITVEREKVIYHFPGGPGAYDSKFAKMTYFWDKMNC